MSNPDFERINKIAEKIIKDIDHQCLMHYILKSIDESLYEEIEQNVTDELTPYEIEKIVDKVYKHVIWELAKSTFDYIRFTVPEYKTILYNKLIKQWKKQ